MNRPLVSPEMPWSDAPAGLADRRADSTIDSALVDRLQLVALNETPDPLAPVGSGLPALVQANHRWNRLLWTQEDEARRLDVPDAAVVSNKRAIDRYNQQRNDTIEAIDELLLRTMRTCPPRHDAWFNSETAGSVIDRLSINLLKLHHMRLQADRPQAPAGHRERCLSKLAQLGPQRDDLLACLQRLLEGLGNGRCFFRLYRQHKMYNDPALNPCLHGAQSR